MSNEVDGVREVGADEASRLEAKGMIADLSRNSLIVHVGKPVGSVTGWVGPLFWQVWVDRGQAPGTVRARIDEGDAVTWQFDATLEKAALLDQAKDRIVAEADAIRLARLEAAQDTLARLTA